MRKMIFASLLFILLSLVIFTVSYWCYSQSLIHINNLTRGETLDRIKLGTLLEESSLKTSKSLAIEKSGNYAIYFHSVNSDKKTSYRQFKRITGGLEVSVKNHVKLSQDVLKLDGCLYEKNSTKVKSVFTQSFFLNKGDKVSISIDFSNDLDRKFIIELGGSSSP